MKSNIRLPDENKYGDCASNNSPNGLSFPRHTIVKCNMDATLNMCSTEIKKKLTKKAETMNSPRET